MERPREELLAGAALAGEQHRALGGADPLQQADGGAQPRMGAHDRRHAGGPEDGLLAALADRPLDQPREVVDLQRLLQEVVGAELHRLDGGAHRAVAGEHHDRHPRLGRPAGRQHLDPRDVGELQVGEHEVEGALGEEPDAGAAVRRRLDVVPLLAQRPLQHAPKGVAVLDDQDAAGGHFRARISAGLGPFGDPARIME